MFQQFELGFNFIGYRGANSINTLTPGPEIGIEIFYIEGNITQNIFFGVGVLNWDYNKQFGYLELGQFELGLVFPMNSYKTRLYITQRLGFGIIHPTVKNFNFDNQFNDATVIKFGEQYSQNEYTISKDRVITGVFETAIRLEHSLNKKWHIFTEFNMKYLATTGKFWVIDPEGGRPTQIFVDGEGNLLKGFVPAIRFGFQFGFSKQELYLFWLQ